MEAVSIKRTFVQCSLFLCTVQSVPFVQCSLLHSVALLKSFLVFSCCGPCLSVVNQLRRIIGDFAVLISVVIWMVANIVAKVNTRTLIIPNVIQDGLTPTACSNRGSDCNIRGWIVNPMRSGDGVELPVWAIFAATIPAVLAVVLVFMDQQITAVIVNRKDFKLKVGWHSDTFVLV